MTLLRTVPPDQPCHSLQLAVACAPDVGKCSELPVESSVACSMTVALICMRLQAPTDKHDCTALPSCAFHCAKSGCMPCVDSVAQTHPHTTLPLQAVVAGNAAVLPLLSCMRIAFKGALTEMHNGLRLSVNLYFATATIVVLIAGAVYMIVVRPAVAAVMMDVDDQQLPCFCKQVSVSGKSLQPSTIKSTKSAVLSRARQPSPDFADVELQRTVSKKRLKLPQALMRHQSDCIIKRNKLEDTIQDWSGHDAIIVLQGQVWLSSTGSLNSSIHHHQQLQHRDCPSIILQFATPAHPPVPPTLTQPPTTSPPPRHKTHHQPTLH